jgi:hypothetical protein
MQHAVRIVWQIRMPRVGVAMLVGARSPRRAPRISTLFAIRSWRPTRWRVVGCRRSAPCSAICLGAARHCDRGGGVRGRLAAVGIVMLIASRLDRARRARDADSSPASWSQACSARASRCSSMSPIRTTRCRRSRSG